MPQNVLFCSFRLVFERVLVQDAPAGHEDAISDEDTVESPDDILVCDGRRGYAV